MKHSALVASTAVLLVTASIATAQDATTSQTTTVNKTVNVSGEIETFTPNNPNWDDGVLRGRGTYEDSITTNTTARSLNTSGQTATAVGNSIGATTVTGSAVTVTGSDVFINGGSAVGSAVAISNGSTAVFESLVRADTAGNITNEIDIRAKLVGGWDRIENPDGAELADITLDADDDVNIRTGDDLEVNARSKIQLDAGDDIELDTGANVEVVAADDIEMTATRILGTTGSARSVMQSGSIMNSVTAAGGVSAGSVIANNGSVRMIADENGKIVVGAATDTTTGTTASMYVTNGVGNVHGLVVQETKTTLSGGTNSASMTLDDRGATFSNPVDGSPIQVHGVADGTAPFDAVNVRQLYSGLAAVLASTPEIALAPGKTGMAVGLGGYGNYGAIGIGFGHMYESGTTLKASASKGQYSELAYRASISWNW